LGRVSFNPLKPVPVNFRALRNPRRDMIWVAAAGPTMNIALAILAALAFHLIDYFREMAPTAALIAVLLNPALPTFDGQLNDVQAAARSVGLQLHILRASNDGEIDAAFAAAADLRAGALLVAADPFFYSRRERLVGLASRHAIPAIYE